TKLIVFTDKKVYTDAYNNPRNIESDTGQISPGGEFSEDFSMIVYAIVLDDDGNILAGNQANNFTVRTVEDIKKLDHGLPADTATHHTNIVDDPGILNGQIIFPAFSDDGTNYDTTANDGVYTAFIDLPDYTEGGPSNKANNWVIGTNDMIGNSAHLLVAVNITFDNSVDPQLDQTANVLFTQYNCHQGAEGDHPNPHATGTDGSGTGFGPCTMCHIGYDHLYNYEDFPEFPSDFGDVAHANKLNPPAALASIPVAAAPDIVYNTTADGGTEIVTWSDFLNQGDTSDYCYSCHLNPGSGILDYGAGAERSDVTDRPSCGVASKSLRGGAAVVECHATTNITGSNIPLWDPPAATSANQMILGNAAAAVSHNRSGNSPALPCASCHLSIHSLTLPDPTSDSDLSAQCALCHTSDGPSVPPHTASTTNCGQCHKDGSSVFN
ncbi:MAG: hypothetical protein KAH86_08500, partial [Methanosarcinales archaeon]|nr:hypothetical protein [Methanosarcinales archaeon]